MKTCPSCHQTYPDEIESCPHDGSWLSAEVLDERECPYCAELILKKARVCKHCGHDVEPLAGTGIAAQTPPPARPQTTVEDPSPQPQAGKPAAAASRPPEPAKADAAAQTPSPIPPQRIAEPPTAHPQWSEPVGGVLFSGAAAGRPPAASKTPWLRAAPEPPGRMKYVVSGLVLVAFIAGGIWYFSQSGAGPAPKVTSPSPSATVPSEEKPKVEAPEPSFLLGFRGLHAGQSRAEVESVLRAQNWTMSCEAPTKDGSVDCKCSLLFCNLDFSPNDKLYYIRMMLGIDPPISSQAVYQELASVLGPGTPPEHSVPGWIENMDERVGGKRFEWNTGGRVPCDFNSEGNCPAQRLTLYLAPASAQIELWDYEYLAKSQGITKQDPNRPRPKVDKTFVLFGLKGGESREAVEVALEQKGFSSLVCKHDSSQLTDQCDTTSGNYGFSLSFFHGSLESFRFSFSKPEWKEYVGLFEKALGEPTDTVKRTHAEVISWQSEQTTPCTPPNDEGKQCPAEFLMLSTTSEAATAQALYTYAPLFNEMIVESAQRMMQGRTPQ